MTNITFSVDDELHKKMKEHPEIKWTELLRQSIINYLKKVEEIDVISMKSFRKRLDTDLLKKIDELEEKHEIEFYKKIKKQESDCVKQLIDSERSENQ